MSSLLTNTAAMTALQTLAQTNKSMAVTQNRISTGLRVATASDNAAYWSIATGMRSDNKALSTVQDALGLGAAQVDLSYTAMENAKDLIDEIKNKVIAAKTPGLDKAKIQNEISQLQQQLKGVASAATGTSWMSVDSSSSSWTGTQKIVSTFSRMDNGSISIGTIDINLTKIALFDSSATDPVGLLDKGVALTSVGGLQDATEAAGDGTDAAEVTLFTDVDTDGVTLEAGNVIKFDLVFNGESKTIVIDKATVDAALSSTDGVIADAADMVTVVELALQNAGFDTTADLTVADDGAGGVTLTHVDVESTSTLAIENSDSSSNGNFFGATDVDITNATEAELDSFIAGLEAMGKRVTTAASDLGAVKSRVDLQKDFVKSMMDSITRGVGQLVDADMNAESTRLQALQVQQQLGIQALSIANANSQNILALFR